jgi:pilus assembly protein Flp/PilA
MFPLIPCMVHDEDGATMVEYGLLVALIAMVALGSVTALGVNVSSLYSAVGGYL